MQTKFVSDSYMKVEIVFSVSIRTSTGIKPILKSMLHTKSPEREACDFFGLQFVIRIF